MSTEFDKDEKIIKNLKQIKYFKYRYGYECVKEIRFSCAYLFRIKVDNTYFLVKDEQRRNKFQPVGGVYKYTDKSIIHKFKATQSTNLGYKADFNDDLRILVPRNKANSFYRWFQKQIGRENIENLYREFKEEIIDKIILPSKYLSAFEEINYRYCGESIAASTDKDKRTEETRLQLRITDIVELNLTEDQLNVLRELKSQTSPLYCFATEKEINDARHNKPSLLSSKTIISSHSYKILPSEELNLKVRKKKLKTYTAKFNGTITSLSKKIKEIESNLKICDENSPFFFISYNSVDKLTVYSICTSEPLKSRNLWIDKTEVGADWNEDVNKALNNANCKLSIVFINEYYLTSEPCLDEAKIIVEKNIQHIIYLIGLDREDIKNLFLRWSDDNGKNKERLKVLKRLFNFDNDTNLIKNTVIEIKDNLQTDHTQLNNFINKHLS